MRLTKCFIYLTMYDSNGNAHSHSDYLVLDLDGDVDKQILQAFPDAEVYSYVSEEEMHDGSK